MRFMLLAAAAVSCATAVQATDKLVIDVPSLQEAPPKTAAQPKEKVICRSDYAIGSLVKRNRWCATASEWRQSERSAKVFTDGVQSDKGRYDPLRGPATDVFLDPSGHVAIGGH